MIIKDCKALDLSDLGAKAVACYLAAAIAGAHNHRKLQINRYIVLFVRLIDKARNEYNFARDIMLQEEAESSLSYEEIIERGTGQFLFTAIITDHLENCVNAVSRIYKLLDRLLGGLNTFDHRDVINLIRNTIEHMDERISQEVEGPLSLNISSDALVVKITNQELKLNDLAREIKALHKLACNFNKLDDLLAIIEKKDTDFQNKANAIINELYSE